MKKYIKIIIFFNYILFSNSALAQINNNGIFFQAIARDMYTNPAKEKKLYVESSIIQYTETGNKVFTELHQTNTDLFGVFNITLGGGKWIAGVAKNLTSIDWANGPFFLNIKISISPNSPVADWDFTKEWIDLGSTPFGTVPYALYSSSRVDVSNKLSIVDTTAMLLPYKNGILGLTKLTSISDSISTKVNTILDSKLNSKDSSTIYVTPYQLASKTFDITPINTSISTKLNLDDTITLSNRINLKLNSSDTAKLSNSIHLKLNSSDTSLMLTRRINKDTSFLLQKRDTASLSTRINSKVDSSNKSINLFLTSDQNDIKFPSVKAVTDYVDSVASTITAGGASPATAINYGLIKLNGDLSNTPDLPLISANAISSSKILDGTIATADLADASITDIKISTGINKSKVGLSNVTDHAQIYSLNSLTTQSQLFAFGTSGTAPNFSSTIATHTLHIPMAAATSVIAGLLSKLDYDKFDTKQNTLSLSTVGSAGAATYSATTSTINIPTYTLSGLGGQVQLNGTGLVKATGTTISYDNTTYLSGNQSITLSGDVIGSGTTSITTSVININGQKMASLNTGILKNTTTTGVPSIAVAGTDYENPLTFSTPLSRATNSISIPVATTSANGYLNSTDWNTFNNKQTSITASNTTTKYWNGYKLFVSLTTDSIAEGGSNKFYTDARARAAFALTVTNSSGASTYSSTTGILNVPTYTLSGLGGQVQLNGTGLVKASGTSISYDNATYINTGDTASMLLNRLKITDTSSMLSTRLKVSDTASMLSSRFARDTVALSNRINLKLDRTNPTITGLVLIDTIKATRYSSLAQPTSIAAASPTNINLSLGNIFTIAMGTTISSLTFTNPAIGTYLIKFVQDATGNREVTTWPANLKWAGGTQPTFTNAASKIDIVTLIYDGTNYYGAIVQNF